VSRIARTFSSLRNSNSGAYIPYVCAGDPNKEFTIALVESLSSSGADIIELGLPFSDPIADGPTIQKAMNRSIAGGFKVKAVFEIASAIRKKGIERPIVLMTYANPALRMGMGKFCRLASESGADAILPVDIPPEESSELDGFAKDNELDLIRLIAPNTSDARLRFILSRASGFVYAVSVAGVTGARNKLDDSATRLLRDVTSRSSLPVVLGFGISRPEHVRDALLAGAAGVVEGSQLVSLYSSSLDDGSKALKVVADHVAEMKAATILGK